jgi:glycosyltransferase involved in cell wall biosynthesis
VCIYHNVTPFYFFDAHGELEAREACIRGRMQNYVMKIRANYFWHVSAYNASEFAHEGNFVILPILRKYHRLSSHPDDIALKNSLKSPEKTLLFVGKLMRHKSQHDLLVMLKLYQDFYGTPVRLVLVGNGPQTYFEAIKRLGTELNLTISINDPKMDADIHIFTTCSDPQLATIYRMADVFVCLSEHEGFCVPLVEAMTFGLPIIGNDSSAIPETCDRGATIVNKNNVPDLLAVLHRLLTEEKYHQERAQASLNRANDFADSNLELIFDTVLEKTLQRKKMFDTR